MSTVKRVTHSSHEYNIGHRRGTQEGGENKQTKNKSKHNILPSFPVLAAHWSGFCTNCPITVNIYSGVQQLRPA